MKRSILLLLSLGCSLLLGAQEGDWEIINRENYSEKILYDGQNRPQEIIISRQGLVEETQKYTYDENRIFIATEGIGERGETSWKDTLFLRKDGSLRMMRREGKGDSSSLGWEPLSGWISHEDYSEIIIYNEQGMTDRRALYNGETLVEEEKYHYDSTGELSSRRLENYLLHEVWEREYLPGELIKEMRQYRSDLLVSQTLYSYNETGKPIERITLGKGQTQSWTASYNSEGSLLEEKYYNGGLLSRVVLYGEDEKPKRSIIGDVSL
jgi:antitoxin component YwqK of YwqJK toxin-antitoxin module